MSSTALIGCNAFALRPNDTSPSQLAYQERLAGLMNVATLPFYWGAYEPEQGAPREARLRAMAEWCRAHGIAPKGHPLCWHQTPPTWSEGKTMDTMWNLQLERIHREVAAFRGLIDTWDVVNEAVVMPRFEQTPNPMTPLVHRDGVVPVLKQAFDAARQANPDATLLLNDFDHSAAYETLIAACLDAGVAIDAIGIQSHMHKGYIGDEVTRELCDRFGRFGKPLHWTEVTLISGEMRPNMSWFESQAPWPSTEEGEQRQAQAAERFYRILMDHPAVEAITWWDLVDGCWLGAPAGLLRADMTPKPTYERLRALRDTQACSGA